MKWKFLTATLFALLAGTQIVAAQSSPAPDNHANHHATQAPGPAASATQNSDTPASPGGAMMGKGAMGGPMMGGMCPMMDGGMMGGAKTKVDVKKIDKGVTITLTSSDAATVTRLQKMAEAMRLMHEAATQ
jgi:predicted lipid-binding transport protein (Tim44 family)